jgi:alpha-L-fucosidase 2
MSKKPKKTFHYWLLISLMGLSFIGCNGSDSTTDEAISMNAESDKKYELWEPAPAPNRGVDFDIIKARGYPFDEDWERWSFPIGNGTLGANLFGRTDSERIQLSEKSIANGGCYDRGAITNAAELYLDFEHPEVSNYRRTLNLNDAIATVAYHAGETDYQREYFTSYPDDLLVVHLTADGPDGLSFTVRPEIPYLESTDERDSKSVTVTTSGDTITLAGVIDFFELKYSIQVRVLHEGGQLVGGDETIEILNADAVTILVAIGTNYELNTKVFSAERLEKLDHSQDPNDRVSEKIRQAVALGYDQLKSRHLADYQGLFDRVAVDLNSEVSELPTHQLLAAYQDGQKDPYLEELMFQYGRYLLIASSRATSLPAHLQGAWTQYEVTPWSGGYWHNINVQMNYWGAMSTDLAETFEAYINFFEAYRPLAEQYAQDHIGELYPEQLSDNPKENGWIFGNGLNPYFLPARAPHSGPGTAGLTTKMLMDYYDFTQDKDYLREIGYPALLGLSRFFAKALEPTEDGLLLMNNSASPEIRHPKGGDYYKTIGSTFDQGFVWENHNDVLRAAKVLGENDPFLKTIEAQMPRLDPIQIGSSGQIKEFREEDAYGDIGDPKHRHISHLCTLYPGTLINSANPEWMKAASTTLDFRGNDTTGWAMAHRMNARARLKEAEKAYDVYSKLIAEKTLENLWATHPPFQVDANLGLVAGVAEMLLQSHEGVIELLPALPEAWAEDGSFHGLVARGNFKVSAEWAEGQLRHLSIKSRSGQHCRLKYPGLSTAAVYDEKGQAVSFETTESDIISFPTENGRIYSIRLNSAGEPLKSN